MAEISKITLPGGTTYDIKDSTARAAIEKLQNYTASGVQYIGTTSTALSDGSTTAAITIDDKEVTATTGDMVSYNNVMYAYNGSQWDQLGTSGAFHALAYQDSVTGKTKPTGDISEPSFTGTEGTVSVSGTTDGTVGVPKFTGKQGTVNVTGTADGDVSVKVGAATGTETNNYVPSGTVSVEPTTTSIKQITSVGTLPDFTATVTDEALKFTWGAGTLPTAEAATVATGVKTASFEGTGALISAEFKGKSVSSTGTFTPDGDVAAPSFTGKAITSTGSFTPAGKISKPTFTGDEATIVSK